MTSPTSSDMPAKPARNHLFYKLFRLFLVLALGALVGLLAFFVTRKLGF